LSDVVTGAVIGAGAVVLGAVVAGAFDIKARQQDRLHDSTERAADRGAATAARHEERRFAWVDRAAETLAQMLEFATDVHPANSTALIQDAEQARAKFEGLEAKWEALRRPLGVLIIGLPSLEQRDLAEEVLERFRRVYNGLSWVLSDIAQGRGHNATTILSLTADWSEASTRLRELRESIHGSSEAVPGP